MCVLLPKALQLYCYYTVLHRTQQTHYLYILVAIAVIACRFAAREGLLLPLQLLIALLESVLAQAAALVRFDLLTDLGFLCFAAAVTVGSADDTSSFF
jgi:hypothetical protein